MEIFLLFMVLAGTHGYMLPGKEDLFSTLLLRELAARLSADYQMPEEPGPYPPLDYDDAGLSLRDQEFLEHSTLWGGQPVASGDMRQKVLPDQGSLKAGDGEPTLPAYCNPPNPCPVGYSAENGCIEGFENTASFSRRYQASQDCMCDSEHMFDCPNLSGNMDDESESSLNTIEFNRFLQHSIQMDPEMHHKNLVAKKFHQSKKSLRLNPFLEGERLPVAAKKGNNVFI